MRRVIAVGAAAAVWGWATPAPAQTLFQSAFTGPADTGAAVGPTAAAGTAYDGMPAEAFHGSGLSFAPGAATGQLLLAPQVLGAAQTGHVRLSAAVRLDGPTLQPPVTANDLLSVNLVGFNSAAQPVAEALLSANGTAYAYNPAATGAASYVAGTPAAAGQYHVLGLDLDFADKTIGYSVDGKTIGSAALSSGLTAADLKSFTVGLIGDAPGGRYDPTRYTAYVGSVTAAVVPAAPPVTLPPPSEGSNPPPVVTPPAGTADTPEPGTLVLAGLGAAAVGGARRRR